MQIGITNSRNVSQGSTINNQDISITPTKSETVYTADEGYTGLGTVTVKSTPLNNAKITSNLDKIYGFYSDSVTSHQGGIGLAQVLVQVRPDLRDLEVTSNGTYSNAGYGMSLSHRSVTDKYTGSVALVGDYAWLKYDDLYNYKVGDKAYNGKEVNGEIVPDFDTPIGELTKAKNIWHIQYSFEGLYPSIYWTVEKESFYTTTIDDSTFYKAYFPNEYKDKYGFTSNYVWILLTDPTKPSINDRVYDSTDSTGDAPNFSKRVGIVNYLDESCTVKIDTFKDSAYFDIGPIYTFAASMDKVCNGFNTVTVNVSTPPAIGSEIDYTNVTGADVKANDKLYINNSAIATTVASAQPDITSSYLAYTIQTTDPNIIICNDSVYTYYNGSYTNTSFGTFKYSYGIKSDGVLNSSYKYVYNYKTGAYKCLGNYAGYIDKGFYAIFSDTNIYQLNTSTFETEKTYSFGVQMQFAKGWCVEDGYLVCWEGGSTLDTCYIVKLNEDLTTTYRTFTGIDNGTILGSLDEVGLLFQMYQNVVQAYQYTRNGDTVDDVTVTRYDVSNFPADMQRMFTVNCKPFWNAETKVLSAYFSNGTVLAYQYISGEWIDRTPIIPNIQSGKSIQLTMSADFSKIVLPISTSSIVYDGNQLATGNYAVPYPYTNEASLIASAKADVASGGTGTAVIGTGVSNQTISVTPSTEAQTIYPQSNYTGIGQVNVSAVTSSIDSNIKAANIKSGVSILGVSGSVTPVNNTTASITANGTYTPDSSYTGYSKVTVNVPSATTTLSVTPSTSAQTLTPESAYVGYSQVDVSAVDASIDANIVAENIKSGVTILGVTGTYTGE